MMYGDLFQVVKVRVIESDGGSDILVPTGTIVKTVALTEAEQQIPDIAKYQVIEVAFPDDETKRQYGLEAGGNTVVVSLGKEFIGALPERMASLGVFKAITAPSDAPQS